MPFLNSSQILAMLMIAIMFSSASAAEDTPPSELPMIEEDSVYLIDESDAQLIGEGELTEEGERALEQYQLLQSGDDAPALVLGSEPTDALVDDVDTAAMDEQVQSLKDDVLILNRELFILEEQLLFPSNTQFAVYVSVDVGEFFEMESVRVLMDNKPVASYLYTKRESDALMRGGVHRIYMGNLTSGEHELVAYYTGRGPRGRDFKRATNRMVNKEMGPKYVELKITDNSGKKQSDFTIREW